jgi:transcriptional antiterminator RfaH
MSISGETGKSWFLIYAKSRQEEVARDNLARQDYCVYLPLAQMHRIKSGRRVAVIQPLFPRYLFIQLDTSSDNWAPIRSTKGVSSLVRFGVEPGRIPDQLIQLLQQSESESGLHDWVEPEFAAGQAVCVMDGSMRGYEGIFIAKSGKERVLVLLDILGRQVRTQLALGQIEPVNYKYY